MNKYAFCLLLLSSQAFAGLDYQCMDDCSDRRYSFQYCQQVCTVHDQQRQIRPTSPVNAYLEGQRARQEYELREQELELMRAEQHRREQAGNLRKEEAMQRAVKAWAEEEEIKRLKAENEALRKKLAEAKADDVAPEPVNRFAVPATSE